VDSKAGISTFKPFPWSCPFCNRDATITESDIRTEVIDFGIENISGPKIVVSSFIVCPNPKCKKFTLTVSLYNARRTVYRWDLSDLIKQWRLIPPSEAKVFPDYIPKPILDDYAEACLIKDLSPKASATLSRRCLQGMIRDFWGVKKPTLKQEIEEIEDKVDPLTWQAIDAVRRIGNIGAHMELDINLIMDVEPDEASLLIQLIETLIKDWYITRYEREERLKQIVEVANQKESQKKGSEESPKKNSETSKQGEEL